MHDVKPAALERGWRYIAAEVPGEQSLTASRSLPEDEVGLRLHGRERAEQHHYARRLGTRRIEEWYARLYSVSRSWFPETFVCEIPDALVMGPVGIVVTPNWEVLSQSNLGAPPASALWWALRDAGDVTSGPLPGSYVSLLTFASKSYAHWLLDSLPRLVLAEAHYPGCKVIVPGDPVPFQLQALELLGIDEERIVRQREPGLHVERLLLTCASTRLTDPRAAHLLALRDRLLEAVHGTAQPKPARRVLVSRARATRPLSNQSELDPVLDELGVEVLVSEDLTLERQIEVFSQAQLVVGAHGAGLHNHVFSRPGTAVVELFNPRLWTPSVLRTASVCGHRHYHTFGRNTGNRFETFVDPERLRRILELAL